MQAKTLDEISAIKSIIIYFNNNRTVHLKLAWIGRNYTVEMKKTSGFTKAFVQFRPCQQVERAFAMSQITIDAS